MQLIDGTKIPNKKGRNIITSIFSIVRSRCIHPLGKTSPCYPVFHLLIQPTQQLRVVSSWFGSIFVLYFCFSVEALLTLIETYGLSLSLHRTSHRTRTETVSRSGTDELLHACVSCRTEAVLLSVQVRILCRSPFSPPTALTGYFPWPISHVSPTQLANALVSIPL